MPYQLPQPAEAGADLVVSPAIPEDERIWVPQAPNVDFRPLCLCTSRGYWMNLLRVRKSGRAQPAPPSAAGARLRPQGPLALSRA